MDKKRNEIKNISSNNIAGNPNAKIFHIKSRWGINFCGLMIWAMFYIVCITGILSNSLHLKFLGIVFALLLIQILFVIKKSLHSPVRFDISGQRIKFFFRNKPSITYKLPDSIVQVSSEEDNISFIFESESGRMALCSEDVREIEDILKIMNNLVYIYTQGTFDLDRLEKKAIMNKGEYKKNVAILKTFSIISIIVAFISTLLAYWEGNIETAIDFFVIFILATIVFLIGWIKKRRHNNARSAGGGANRL